MAGEPTLAERVRAKYPGAYDDIPDDVLEQRIRAKFPGVYDDIPSSAPRASLTASAAGQATVPAEDTLAGRIMAPPETVGEAALTYFNPGTQIAMATGLAKGAANTVAGVGDAANWLGSQAGIVDRDEAAFDAARAMTAPANAGEALGRGAEQVAEFVALPSPAKVKGAARALELGKAGVEAAALSKAQGASTGEAVTAGVLSGVPVVEGVAKGGKYLGDRMVRSVLKPTVAAMRRISGGSTKLLEARASELVDFIVRNNLTTPEKAGELLTRTEQELQRILAVKNAPTDAPTRAVRYLEALERRAAKQGMPAHDVAVLRAKAEEVVAGPMGQDVVTMVPTTVATGLVDSSGAPITRTVMKPETTRALRPDMPAAEALESARASSKFNTRGKWGIKDQAEAVSGAAVKAVEKAQRDAVKAAVPEAKPLLRREGQAIQAREALDRAAFREGNQNLTGIAGAVGAGTASGAGVVLGFAARLLREKTLGSGVKVGQLARALEEGNASKVAFFLKQLGVALPSAVPAAP
jgi:hypothetical protein